MSKKCMKETYFHLQTYEIFLKIMYLKLLQEYWTYEWNLWNRLIEVKQYNAPDNGECVEVSYEYDALNHRISRTTDSETTKYAYGRNGALAYQEKTVDGSAFISEDPSRDGANWYGYAGQNPMVYTDPTELAPYLNGIYDGPYNPDYNPGVPVEGPKTNPNGMPQSQSINKEQGRNSYV